MARQKPFLNYRGIKVYRGLKDDVEKTFGYTKKQNHQIEGAFDWFDIRRLPRRYRNGLNIEPSFSGAFSEAAVDRVEFERIDRLQREAHEEVLQRAIDDDYDFDAATRDNYGQFLRRLKRWWRLKFGVPISN